MTAKTPGRGFPTTSWVVIRDAQQGRIPAAHAFEMLFATYRGPLYAYVRAKGHGHEQAQDLVQDFFATFIERNALAYLSAERGRLRAFLRVAMDRHLVSAHRRRVAHKRGAGKPTLSLDAEDAVLPFTTEDPLRVYEREWARCIFNRAFARLKGYYEQSRPPREAAALLAFFQGHEAPSYAEAARSCDVSPSQLRGLLCRARIRFREIVRAEVRAAMGADVDVEREIQDLFSALGS